MDLFESHSYDGYFRGSGYTCGISINEGITRSRSFSVSPSSGEAGTPWRSYAGSPATIARCIFRDELSDVLKVLRNCGALHSQAEKAWCLRELERLLDELDPGDLA